ncbi:conserved hypothetical protein [Gluconacetobacter diazotrophicus PA1 5]|uniref:Uncharacterized protein n=2 Tax=Gluconacetobacter diazotrophicus TaxID=33996 RepID=A9HBZ1_GLUDA|nr:hypothetical protein [Gluconacetobacter diazotrophicus]ACI50873.1 conserved hypothetical protein [Gluconacetobacter diazotrophicus PA1 5]MBB2156191.1 hypothetical protein [Gluconacetobacter diazotrophicus]TWB08673.1 hypothetical protein FBZ86_106172 [Gluconacetobacter diazotrophicus]CAP54875.1 hypothetical protein GDI0932 [Gluconacetobacter diazotrophicus PA1 5]
MIRVFLVRRAAGLIGAAGLLALSGCLDVPHPFRDPGRLGRSLAANAPPARLAVPTPPAALLGDAAAREWSHDVAAALLDQSVPAMAQPIRAGDWWLRLGAVTRGGQVIPTYSVMTPSGAVRSTDEGAGVSAAAWAAGDPATLRLAARQAAPGIAASLTGIQADQMDHDPRSLKHRAARIWFAGVRGAPGDGDVALARAFAAALRDASDAVQNTSHDADFTVSCVVTVSDGPAGTTGHPQQHLQLVWRVVDSAGKEAGAATQLHDIDAHTLDGHWGDVAVAAAQEAAGGVRQVVSRYSGRDNVPLPPPGGAPVVANSQR